MESERNEVLGKIVAAINLLESSSEFSNLIPEVRVNVVCSLSDTNTVDDVAAVDGRITIVNGYPKAAGYPKFGASDHMARAILEIRKYEPKIRAGINFKFNKEITDIVEKFVEEKSLTYGFIDRKKEPKNSKISKVKSMPWKIKYLKDTYGFIPTIFYESAGWGKEPLFVIIGEDLVKIVKMVIEIAIRYANFLKN
jgi:predicted fused transcriptional regulator/phosphomethylpyrimidine kinase